MNEMSAAAAGVMNNNNNPFCDDDTGNLGNYGRKSNFIYIYIDEFHY